MAIVRSIWVLDGRRGIMRSGARGVRFAFDRQGIAATIRFVLRLL